MVGVIRHFLMISGLALLTFGSLSENNQTMETIGSFTMENHIYDYGYRLKTDGTYDAVIEILDTNSQTLVHEVVVDEGAFERFVYLAKIGGGELVGVCEIYAVTPKSPVPTFLKTIMIRMDSMGHEFERIIVKHQYDSFHNHNNQLVLTNEDVTYFVGNDLVLKDEWAPPLDWYGSYLSAYRGEAYVNGEIMMTLELDDPGYYTIRIVDGDYEYTYSVVVHPVVDISGQSFEEDFIGELTVTSTTDFYLNGIRFQNTCVINQPGNYHLLIEGAGGYQYIRDFVVFPRLVVSDGRTASVLKEEDTYQMPVTIFSDALSLLLDGEEYMSTRIESPGTHELVIYGVNQFRATVTWFLEPSVQGVEDAKTYESLCLDIFGDARLNGDSIHGRVEIDRPGTYTLELMLDGEVWKTYHFSVIQSQKQAMDSVAEFNYVNLIWLGLVLLGGYFIFRK